jgi:peroxygenase
MDTVAVAAPPASTDNNKQQQHKSAAAISSLPGVPCTVAFPAPGPELADALPNPHVPRADVAPSAEKPMGEPALSPYESGMSVIQRHCLFWDRSQTGVIYPADTYWGFHAIGLPRLLAALAVPIIHLTFAAWTCDSMWQLLRDLPRGAPLHVARMDRCLHGSDSRTYDTEGRFRPEAFESIFSKFGVGSGSQSGITWSGVLRMLGRNRSIMDPVGSFAAFLEWGTLYLLAADHSVGVLQKEDVRACFDGTLWPKLAERVAARRARGVGGGWMAWGGSGGASRPHAA